MASNNGPAVFLAGQIPNGEHQMQTFRHRYGMRIALLRFGRQGLVSEVLLDLPSQRVANAHRSIRMSTEPWYF